MAIPNERLSGAKVLVTGASGLIGQAVAYVLAKNNEVHGLARWSKPEVKERLKAAGVKPIVRAGGYEPINDLDRDYDAVFHEAVAWHGSGDRQAFETAVRTNTYFILDLVEHLGDRPKWVIGSTAAMHVSPDWGEPPPSEDEGLLQAGNVYRDTKLAGELACSWISERRGIPMVFLSYCMPDSPWRGLARGMLERVLKGEAISVHPERPQPRIVGYISNIVDQTVAAIGHGTIPPNRICSTGDRWSNEREIAEIIGEEAGVKPRIVLDPEMESHNRDLDLTKMKRLLGEPAVDMREAIRRDIRGYRQGSTGPEDWMFE